MKVLLVADQPGWIFDRHCNEIKNRSKHEVDIAYRKQNIREISKKYDLVYVLDPMPLKHGYPHKEKTIMGLRCEFLYREHPNGPRGLYENGFPGRCVSIKDKCSIFHVVNKRLINVFKDIVVDKPLLLVGHGVNTDVFDVKKNNNAFNEIDGKLQVSVSGRGSKNKGFDLVKKACDAADVQIITAQYGKQKLTLEEMPHFYSKANVHVCMSKDEGLNNPILESGAMGLAPISTISGAADEMIINNESGILIERNIDSLVYAIEKMKSNDRISMARKFNNEIIDNWSWDVKIKEYEKMFDLYFEGIK